MTSSSTQRNRTLLRVACAAAAAVTMFPFASPAADTAKATLSEAEIQRVLSHGPWPIPAKNTQAAKPLNLTAREQTDLVVFLETLSAFSNPWRPDDNGRCD